jgi:hypothetical protein
MMHVKVAYRHQHSTVQWMGEVLQLYLPCPSCRNVFHMLLTPEWNQNVRSEVLTAVKPCSSVQSTDVSGERTFSHLQDRSVSQVRNQLEVGGKHSRLVSFFFGLLFYHEDGYGKFLESLVNFYQTTAPRHRQADF